MLLLSPPPSIMLVAKGSVTLANSRISAVANTAFVDFSAANVLTDYVTGHHYLILYDSTMKTITGYIKAAGTGETLGAEIHTSANAASDPNANEADATTGWTSGGLATFESTGAGTPNVGAKHLHGITNAFSQQAYYSVAAGTGKLFKITLDAKEIAGHTDVRTWFRNAANDGWLKYESVFPGDSAYHSYTYYVVADGATFLLKVGNGGADPVNEFYFDNVSVKQALTPSATGVTITTTPGGTTQSWTSQTSGFAYNDASGFTYKIYRVRR
jgi:hypothetical protein